MADRVWLVFIAAVVVGFAVGVRFNYVRNPESARTRLRELVLFVDDSCYHIHHSIVAMVFIAWIAFGRIVKDLETLYAVVGVLVGASLMDLLYPDWYLVKNHCHPAKILQYFRRHPPGSRTGAASSRT
jgi:hypothetical protein